MGKPSETPDDIAVAHGVGEALLIAERAKQVNATFLVLQDLRVVERQIQKETQVGVDVPVATGLKRGLGDLERLRVACITARRAAKGMARKLIEQQNQRQCPSRRPLPVIEIAAASRFVGIKEC